MSPPDPLENRDPRPRERLSAYLDGELSPDEAREVRAWLESDPAALREAEELRRVWDLLGRYPDEPVPEGFADGVLARARAARDEPAAGPSSSSSPRSGWRVLVGGGSAGRIAAAAGVVLALGLGAVVATRALAPAPTSTTASSMLEALPAEAVENISDLAALSDAQFEAILSSDPDDLARLLEEAQGG